MICQAFLLVLSYWLIVPVVHGRSFVLVIRFMHSSVILSLHKKMLQ